MTTLPIQVTLPFVGKRNYLHAPTLFGALWPFVPYQARLSFKLPRLILSNRVQIVDLTNSGETQESVSATLVFEAASRQGVLGIVALPASSNIQRMPFDESSVTELAAYSEGCVELGTALPFSFIETVASLNKAMLLRQVHHDGPGQWLFTRLDLDWVLEESMPLTMNLQRVIDGQIAKTTILVAGSRVGDLYFSWINDNSGLWQI